MGPAGVQLSMTGIFHATLVLILVALLWVPQTNLLACTVAPVVVSLQL